MKQLESSLFFVLVLGLFGVSNGQNPNTHTVTVKVQQENDIIVKKRTSIFTLSEITSRENPSPRTNTGDHRLRWTSDTSRKKITVGSNVTSKKLKLFIHILDRSGRLSNNRISLTDFDQDLIHILPQENGLCTLKHEADDQNTKNCV